MPEKIFGVPTWAAVVTLGAAGVVGYLIFFKNAGGGSSSSGSTYSAQGLAVMQNPDESATMALQNQELSLLGNQFNTFATSLGNMQTSVDTGNANNDAYYKSLMANLTNYANALFSQGQSTQTQVAANVNRQFADFTYLEAGPSDPRIQQWIEQASRMYAAAAAQNPASLPAAQPAQTSGGTT